MNQKKSTDQFHDSESEDIYDLYIAVNGVLKGGLLDVSRLDKLSPEERKVLNVGRLRAIWEHTASGCAECAAIIRTLNRARGVTPADPDDISKK